MTEPRRPWIPEGTGSGGTGSAPRTPGRSGAGEPESVAALLSALSHVRFPATRETVVEACRAGGGRALAAWADLLSASPRERFANAREVREAVAGTHIRFRE